MLALSSAKTCRRFSLVCPQHGGAMRIIAIFIERQEVIHERPASSRGADTWRSSVPLVRVRLPVLRSNCVDSRASLGVDTQASPPHSAERAVVSGTAKEVLESELVRKVSLGIQPPAFHL